MITQSLKCRLAENKAIDMEIVFLLFGIGGSTKHNLLNLNEDFGALWGK